MTHSFKLSRRIARLRAPMFAAAVLSIFGCNQTDSLDPDSSGPVSAVDPSSTAEVETATADGPSLAGASASRGIPLGYMAQPVDEFGGRYSGGMKNIQPNRLLSELKSIKARGGRVVVMFVGTETYYKDRAGHFDFGKWKARVNRYKGINFSSYIKDGTIIGHYLIDEPYDPVNWHGRPIPGSMIDEMAKYSKQVWPTMATIVRAEPAQVGGGPFRYLDVAWAQFTYAKGDAKHYISKNVADAQKRRLGLIVGLNIGHGGRNRSMMSASQVQSFGSALLSSSYPCAFISWKYTNSGHVKSVMDALRRQADSRSAKSCRG